MGKPTAHSHTLTHWWQWLSSSIFSFKIFLGLLKWYISVLIHQPLPPPSLRSIIFLVLCIYISFDNFSHTSSLNEVVEVWKLPACYNSTKAQTAASRGLSKERMAEQDLFPQFGLGLGFRQMMLIVKKQLILLKELELIIYFFFLLSLFLSLPPLCLLAFIFLLSQLLLAYPLRQINEICKIISCVCCGKWDCGLWGQTAGFECWLLRLLAIWACFSVSLFVSHFCFRWNRDDNSPLG